MSDEEMDQECPDFSQIKNSPPSSPGRSPVSARENSVILQARDVAHSTLGELYPAHTLSLWQTKIKSGTERSDLTCLCLSAIGELGGTPVYVMPVSCPAQSELISIISFTTFIPPCSGLTNSKQVNTLVAPPTITGMCHIQIIEEPEEKFR